ncbi:nuclear transport factor 2 family protein [Shewanella sp. ECSMB14102]|uniref:nuclear transport factor 2 family protein n=1 Tax=Shewanella indica TaxID=768528 RepID=UPI00190F8656
MNHISEIQQLESQLHSAMLNSDINLLDRLLSPQLIFTNHLGQVLGKAEDLHAHSSGLLNITRIDTLAEEIRLHQGDCDSVGGGEYSRQLCQSTDQRPFSLYPGLAAKSNRLATDSGSLEPTGLSTEFYDKLLISWRPFYDQKPTTGQALPISAAYADDRARG